MEMSEKRRMYYENHRDCDMAKARERAKKYNTRMFKKNGRSGKQQYCFLVIHFNIMV